MLFLINFVGILLIALIVWWFWLNKTKQPVVQAQGKVIIQVKEGIYQPAIIEAHVNQPLSLRFIREDAQPCAEIVTFSTLNISQVLPLNQPVDINLKLDNPGEYEFTCQMGMYRGKLIIKP